MSAVMLSAGAEALAELRGTVQGEVVAPGDAAYDGMRSVFLSGFDRRPAAIVRAANEADVAAVVSLARSAGLELSVRSGGHSVAGHGVTEGGIMLDLRSLKRVEIDGEGRSAWAGAGATAGEYTAAAAAHGLATPLGDSPSVGLGGLTLGGGVGLLHRRHGLTIDNLLEAEVVTADGERVTASEEVDPDLFWALRGGGGNFGVATRFRFRLVELARIVGGTLILPATPAILTRFLAEAEAAPEGLSGVVGVLPAPPLPSLPIEVHGQPIIMATLVFAGPEEEGERVFRAFRGLARPIVDAIRPMAYPEIYAGPHPPPPAAMIFHSFFMDDFDATAGETVLEALRQSTAPMAMAQFRVLGGAVASVPEEATAFAHRGRRIMAALAAMYPDPSATPVHHIWASGYASRLRHGEPATYVNFLGMEGADRIRAAYPGRTWDRLREVKAKYDPTNLFRLNQNIPPAGA
jgi:FAD/FMN-containing dehydrogenase